MKNLIEMIFKREPRLNYIIAEYYPRSDFVPKPIVEMAEYEVESPQNMDEMQIDNIYQQN